MMNGSLQLLIAATLLLQHVAPRANAQDIRNERLRILAGDGETEDRFGYSVGMSEGIAIVGAIWDDDRGSKSGSAYLIDATTGIQIAKLLASDGAMGDFFGFAVGISGATAVAGAPFNNASGADSGSAYVFDTTTGTQSAKLLPSDGAARDAFGWSVAVWGATCIVGSYLDDDNGMDSGSAYLFDATTGMQIAKLLPGDGATGDYFGISVAISETTGVVGAVFDEENGAGSGSAYLFDHTTGEQIAKLVPSDGAAHDEFGISVAISGTTVIVGAQFDDDNGANTGSAYVFDTTTGRQVAKLLASDGTEFAYFGHSVAISGTTCVVGAYADNVNGARSGSAYLFDWSTGTQLAMLLPSDGEQDDEFGVRVGMDGTAAIVGAHLDDSTGLDSGSAYIFNADGGAPAPILDLSGDCPGRVVVTVTNATPAGLVAIVYGLGDGPTTIPVTLPCAGTVLDVGNPNLANRITRANANGVAVLNTNLPAAACGRVRVQALDLTTCEVSEVVRP